MKSANGGARVRNLIRHMRHFWRKFDIDPDRVVIGDDTLLGDGRAADDSEDKDRDR